jgi:hypothetical protein
MGWKGEPTVQEHIKHHNESGGRLGARFRTSKLDVLLIAEDQRQAVRLVLCCPGLARG